ncbi:MAG TPA: DUF975 family protein [Candidatus Anoxymicrobiaceae bacterium]|jgi:uncharacterized membrane protein
MDKKTFSIGDAVSFGWETMTKNVWFFVLVMLILWIASGIPSAAQSGYGYLPGAAAATLGFIFALIGLVVAVFVNMAQVTIGLDFCDQKPADYGDLVSNYQKFWDVLIGSILYFLIVLAGLILLIIPGIYWAIRYHFFAYLIIDKDMKPVEAIKRSGQLTRGVWWHLFVLALAMFGITLIGVILCGVGLLFTTPIVLVSIAYVYRTLQAATPAAMPVQPPPVPVSESPAAQA